MEERGQFTFYESIYKALKRIKKKQDRADAYDAVCAYALYKEEPNLDSMSDAAAIAFELLRPIFDSARKKAANGKQGGSKPKAKGKQTPREGEKEEENEIENEIEGENEKKQIPPNDGSLFTIFWNAYPETAKRRREEAWNAWKKLNPDAVEAARIMEHLEAWKKSQRWMDDNGEFIPNAENFLDPDRGYIKNKPAPAKQAAPKGASGELGAAELEAIQQVLRLRENGGENPNENHP